MCFFPNILNLVLFFLLHQVWFFCYPTTQKCDVNDIAPHSRVRHKEWRLYRDLNRTEGKRWVCHILNFPQCEKALKQLSCSCIPSLFEGAPHKSSHFSLLPAVGSIYTKEKKIPHVNTQVEDEIQEILRKEQYPNKSLKCQKLVTRRGVYVLYAKMFKSIRQSS